MEEKDLGKILIIDDDEDVLLAAKFLLKKHAHEVIIEKNPKKTQKKFHFCSIMTVMM